MVSLEGFNAENVEPNAPMSPVPAGDYLVVISGDKLKETKSGTGKYLEIEMQIVEEEYKGRKLWDRLNLWNPSQQASQIAQRTLSAICHAVGVLQPRDSSELHNKPLIVDVRCKEYQGNITNEVKGYKARNTQAHHVMASGKSPAASEFSEPIGEGPDKAKTIADIDAQAPWS